MDQMPTAGGVPATTPNENREDLTIEVGDFQCVPRGSKNRILCAGGVCRMSLARRGRILFCSRNEAQGRMQKCIAYDDCIIISTTRMAIEVAKAILQGHSNHLLRVRTLLR